MLKVLWVGDAVINSGFSVVTHNICNRLCKLCNVEVYGIGYDGLTPNKYPYVTYPASINNDIYGLTNINNVIYSTKPDIVVLFNDDHIVERYVVAITNGDSRLVPFFPINMLPLSVERVLAFSNPSYNIPSLVTYTDFSASEVRKINPNIITNAIYHGVEHSVFFPQPKLKSKLGLDDCFIVGTVGSNTYRKRLDLFLRGFAKFAKARADVRCLIHSTNRDAAYNLKAIIRDLGIADKVILSNTAKDFPSICGLYNLMDVNVNTSMGEGFCLPLLEGASCGVPVLCPEHCNLVDIWGYDATYIKLHHNDYIAGTEYIGGVIDIDDLANNLEMFYTNREYLSEMKEKAFSHANNDQFSWDTVTNKMYNILTQANKGRISYTF